MNSKIDVLIVGAGPTGSMLAVDLARRGVTARIIERNSQGFSGSRAKGIQPRSLELLEDIGALDDILAAGCIYPPLGIHVGPATVPKKMFKIVRPTEDIPYPNTWLISQSQTDESIRNQLKPLGLAVEFNSQLVSLEQGAETVKCQIETGSEIEMIEAKYVVGADGGASKVRQGAGIAFPGNTDEADHMIIVDCKIEGLGRKHWHVWPKLGGRFAGACPLPGSDLFQVMIRLQADEEPQMDDAELNKRFCKHTGSEKYQLTDFQWKTIFRPNIRLADNYRKGRVFLIGDAAHVHTPMGAQGLNTGIQDAYNLGWKLGQVLAGAPDKLLFTYEEERQPIAASVLGMSTEKYEALGKLDPSSIKRGKDEQQLSLTYRANPLGVAATEISKGLNTGDRAPDVRLVNDRGLETRLFELTRGPQFTLLSYGPLAAKEMADIRWPEGGVSLQHISIEANGEGIDAQAFKEKGGSFKSIYGIKGNALILIRPDGYIGQIASTDRVAKIESIVGLVAPSLDCATGSAN